MSQKDSRWRTINNLTHKAASRHIFQGRIDAASVCKIAHNLSDGQYITNSFCDGVLKVSVSSYDAVAALMLRQEALIEQINHDLGTNKVSKLRISVNTIAKEDNYR